MTARGGGWWRVAPFLLAACSSQPDAPAGLTADDQQLLNEAGDMLAANSVTPDTGPVNESITP